MQNKQITIALALFISFFSYYSFTGYFLPRAAGPDYPISQGAVHFYLTHERLAVMPQDEALVTFSPYGNTRSMRPPLGFAVAALLAKVSPFLDDNWRYAYRHASAVFCALTVMLVFLGLMLYFNRVWLALLGSLLLALMPQFTFVASYLNDDSSAFFAAAYLFYAMIYLFKRGTSYLCLAHLGLATGLVLISKMTAWLLLPSALLFYIIYILRFNRYTVKYIVWASLFFMIGGGWWCVWNMWHYGLHDPFLMQVNKALASKHLTVDLSNYGFISRNIGFYDLLLYNHADFWGATYQAVIGHIDWLRLRMDSMQYNYYLVFVWAILLYLISSIVSLGRAIKSQKWRALFPEQSTQWVADVKFEAIIVMMFIVQILIYTWHNIHNDIQVQGKYLLPIVFPLLVLSMSLFARIGLFLEKKAANAFRLPFIVIMLLLPFIVHADAIFDVVIPFYWPDLLGNKP